MTIRSWITLGSKYEVEELRRTADKHLGTLYGCGSFAEHHSMRPRRAQLFKDVGRVYGNIEYGHIEVVNLARGEVESGRSGLQVCLSYVFYECSRMSVDDILKGLTDNNIPSLHPKDLAILLKGKERLINYDLDFLRELVAHTPKQTCADSRYCLKQSRLLISNHWVEIVETAGSLLSQQPSIEKLISQSGICKGCRKELGASLSENCEYLWKYLGDVFEV